MPLVTIFMSMAAISAKFNSTTCTRALHMVRSATPVSLPGTSNSLVLSNICQQVTDSCPSNTGGGAGNIAAYNLGIDDVYGTNGWMQGNSYDHASGQDFWLREGESSIGITSDNVHGTHHFTTLFRN